MANLFQVEFIVPSLTGEGKPVLPSRIDAMVEDVSKLMAEICGGGTVFQGEGFWVDASGNLVRETVQVVRSMTDREPTPLQVKLLEEMAETVKHEAEQNAVLFSIVEVSGSMRFV